MSSSRALRLQSALRTPTLRSPAQLAPRRGYAVKEPPAPNPITPSGTAPSASNPKVGTKPDEVSSKTALYLIIGAAVGLGGTFAFLTGAPAHAAGVADVVTRSSNGPSFTPGLGPKPTSERQ
ncbi:hypothetical protein CORC01_00960 [Colletotrichum orchidophilum]|uniref:Uncharacterized protein n=1 Tax=Colletotrichum orchidophilum TaxID=1209926 RepID=A0A1G4BQ98_9PEZI|nr:uncharacterized protein CORC01_00960 [Colletotrichum orchidophilum]OHF03641.1 hypothetical protein CORC01_00960 [Colletotrichum orchidophilum]